MVSDSYWEPVQTNQYQYLPPRSQYSFTIHSPDLLWKVYHCLCSNQLHQLPQWLLLHGSDICSDEVLREIGQGPTPSQSCWRAHWTILTVELGHYVHCSSKIQFRFTFVWDRDRCWWGTRHTAEPQHAVWNHTHNSIMLHQIPHTQKYKFSKRCLDFSWTARWIHTHWKSKSGKTHKHIHKKGRKNEYAHLSLASVAVSITTIKSGAGTKLKPNSPADCTKLMPNL